MEFRCDLIRQDIPTVNNRTYSKACLERIAAKSGESSIVGNTVHLDDYERNLATLVGHVKKCEVKDGHLDVDVTIYPCPSAKMVETLIGAGIGLGITPIIMGEVDKNGNVKAESIRMLGYSIIFKDKSNIVNLITEK